ncbi:MAG: hydroxyethylthiazole kinase [Anaerophaga sp.]|uniref:hydroxyethylthiazole kinase n=1 Tax=Anaerophaga thermohalophila TaxID=177400 RepID=UPI000237BE76|nr:hydroxyethylthiazole kinase [Anaerophaga thermohalophila]MDN5291585.1 hydroxyethylthiazole kinase [Anaerophaga sp.]
MITAQSVAEDLLKLKEQAPLVHNITNYVVMNNTANALLSVGASPVMAHAPEEMEAMAGNASALVINIGTLSKEWIEGMLIAGKAASKRGIPVILDPVGAGATPFRTDTCHQLIKACKPTIIRGNASEIMALINSDVKTKGVDSTESSDKALEVAKTFANETGAVISISGPVDYITDGNHVISIKNHIPLMPKVTGMGCTATTLTGAFAAVCEDSMQAAATAMAVMAVAGEMAKDKARGPGTFQIYFLDALYNLNDRDIAKYLKI